MSYFLQFAKNIFTQTGEDGIIEKLFHILNIKNGVVVEFGAWDGVYLSNVFNLWRYKNYNAILIEGDSSRANELSKLITSTNNVESMNLYVSPYLDNENSLDNILKRSKFKITNDNFSLLSIDVDSCDYYIFDSIKKFLPKVVIIEKNSGFAPDVYFNTYDRGCSLRSIYELAISKGYQPVCDTGNVFLVRNDLIEYLPKQDYSIDVIYSDVNRVCELGKINQIGENEDFYYCESNLYSELIHTEKMKLLEKD